MDLQGGLTDTVVGRWDFGQQMEKKSASKTNDH